MQRVRRRAAEQSGGKVKGRRDRAAGESERAPGFGQVEEGEAQGMGESGVYQSSEGESHVGVVVG